MAWTLTVSELNDYVRRALASDPSLRFISLRGEIGDFKRYASGHWYFTLKDEQSRIQCVCYRQNTARIRFEPANGMKVILGIRPEEFKSEQSASAIEVEATAQKALPMGAGLHVDATNGNQKFLTVLMNHTDVTPGEKLTLHVDPWCIHVFDAETEQNLCKAVYKEVQA